MTETVMKYFGTNTREKGHYLWDVWDTHLSNRSLNTENLPFNPEELVKPMTYFGTVEFMHIGTYSVLTIAGSPADGRPGSKSVFIATRRIRYEVLKDWVMKTESTREIIEKMPFEINWL